MSPALITALAGALLHFLWQGAALALVVALVLLFSRSPRIRYASAIVALFAMPVAFAATVAIVYRQPASIAPQRHISQTLSSTLYIAMWQQQFDSPFAAAQRLMRQFVPFWFAGIALLYLRSGLSWLAVQKLRRSAGVPVSGAWRARLAVLSARLGIDRAVELFESRIVDVPVVAGFLCPIVLIPAGCLANMPVEQIEYLLIHELAHIRRLDYLVNLIQKAVEGLLFYHPAVWWVSSVARREREHCCDDAVLAMHAEPNRYAEALADLEQTRWASVPAANGGDLNARVRRILGLSSKQHVAPTAVASLVMAAAAVLLTMTTLPHVARAQEPAKVTSWERWVNEDVAYIITDAERAAFRNLQTDEERRQFVEQFWDRRNPTPGSATNPLKEEHYRRLAYANQHFAGSLPGWKTDRGRIYITFGPPDEIDSHPSCGPNAPFEDWRYKLIQGIGENVLIEFRDANCAGDYRMTSDPNRARP